MFKDWTFLIVEMALLIGLAAALGLVCGLWLRHVFARHHTARIAGLEEELHEKTEQASNLEADLLAVRTRHNEAVALFKERMRNGEQAVQTLEARIAQDRETHAQELALLRSGQEVPAGLQDTRTEGYAPQERSFPEEALLASTRRNQDLADAVSGLIPSTAAPARGEFTVVTSEATRPAPDAAAPDVESAPAPNETPAEPPQPRPIPGMPFTPPTEVAHTEEDPAQEVAQAPQEDTATHETVSAEAPAEPPAATPQTADTAAPEIEPKRPVLYAAPRISGADALTRLSGIGPEVEAVCNRLGIYHFDQIAKWSDAELAWIDQNLDRFNGAASREDWRDQARKILRS